VSAMTVRGVPRWMPTRHAEVQTLAAGDWWDAVRVPLGLGVHALRHLEDETGAVIRDGYGGILYWLIPPGSAAHRQLPQVTVLGPGCHVAVPPLHRTTGPGLYWQVPPARGRETTAAPRLCVALRASLSHGKRPAA
jgi:hypothetical protein